MTVVALASLAPLRRAAERHRAPPPAATAALPSRPTIAPPRRRSLVAGSLVVAGERRLGRSPRAQPRPIPRRPGADLLRAGVRCVEVFGAFATLTLIAILFWFAPLRELRIVPTLVVLGPLTLLRPLVIVGGLLLAVAGSPNWRVWLAGIAAGVSMIGIEHVLGRGYRGPLAPAGVTRGTRRRRQPRSFSAAQRAWRAAAGSPSITVVAAAPS